MNVTSEHRWGYVEYYVYVIDSQKRVVIKFQPVEKAIRKAHQEGVMHFHLFTE